ncbi:sodium-dependent transporter [Ornithinimicrobium humiphilum]|uniref:NSS family neurotransmitter:Na+ symporter n=1 Tax=Ornithinimicrobium humiphilum TaxID=125288 RepID=A0A543KN61_9MICO|nr:sodium-dependent transporter [Ornithinimicrobium humiphilum]TQM96517.1 NSS family neurotransmitter:Na+ symporter [Ornithinimicrobium humiphilum]
MAETTPARVAPENRETWTGNTGFILAAIGSAVGLGNIWRFPGVAYESGGGAFLIPYLVALLTAGIPILFLDYAIGHRYRGAAPLAYRRMKKKAEALGWFQIMLSFIISVYYAAVIAWALSYFVFAFDLRWGEDTAGFFVGEYLQVSDPGVSTTIVSSVAIPLAVVWIAVLVVLALGVAKGVEKVNVIGIPLLGIAFAGLVIRALTLPGAMDGLNAFFTPDWGALLDLDVWIAAYSQIFFSLSIAFGIMVTYASYQRRKANMTSSGLVVAFANSSFELLAGIGVFATLGFLAFRQSVQIDELEGLTGPILSFVTFPAVISEMPGGNIFGAVFFASLVIAGFTSLISILLGVAATVQEKFGLSWRVSAISVSAVCALISFSLFSTTSGLLALDTVDQFANNVGIVLSAIVMSVLVVWVFRRGQLLRSHLNAVSTFHLGNWWLALVGIVAPVFLVIMLVQKLITLVSEGYEGLPGWYVGIFGWGTLAFALVMSAILTALPWKDRDDSAFRPWPELEEENR